MTENGLSIRPILEFRRVSYHYQDGMKQVNILQSADFAFERGRFYAIVGPSGAGKTTTITLASGLDTPKSGDILYDGESIRRIGLTRYRNRYVSIIFQAYNLIPYMTALQNVVTAMEISGTRTRNRKERALEMLAKVGLSEDQANRVVLKLSGGEQQRVAIARALAKEVDLIFADEPTGNLDQDTADEIIELFKRLTVDDGKCVICVTHSSRVANQADVTVQLRKGRFVVDGPRDDAQVL